MLLLTLAVRERFKLHGYSTFHYSIVVKKHVAASNGSDLKVGTLNSVFVHNIEFMLLPRT